MTDFTGRGESPLDQAMLELLAAEREMQARGGTNHLTVNDFEAIAPMSDWNSLVHHIAKDDGLSVASAIVRGMQVALRAAAVARRRETPLTIPEED